MNEKSKVLDIFKITIDDFEKEYNVIKEKADQVDIHIQEIVRYLETFVEKEESDFKLFSPRDVESVHREEIELKNNEMDQLRKEKNTHFQKMGFLSDHINKLKVVYETISDWDKDEFIDFETNMKEDTYFDSFKTIEGDHFDFRLLVMDVLEKDRERLARDLHDTTIQDLTHVIHVIELAQKFSGQDLQRTKMELLSAEKCIRETIDNLRNVIFDLRPMSIDDLGYQATFERLKFHVEEISDMKMFLDIDDFEKDKNMDFLILFRIIQELCMNAVKHAQATKLELSIKILDKILMLKVVDNGIGFDTDLVNKARKVHFGLDMTRERVNLLKGNMKIVSEKEIGTSIIITVPFTFNRT